MSSHDDDNIDFDFFEDDATREQAGGRGDDARGLVRRGRRRVGGSSGRRKA